jgi:hypothetical protein
LRNRRPVPAAAYVPITVALVGVMFILAGGIKARDTSTLAYAPAAIDTTVTGAIDTR